VPMSTNPSAQPVPSPVTPTSTQPQQTSSVPDSSTQPVR
jgi:hypothetical protein